VGDELPREGVTNELHVVEGRAVGVLGEEAREVARAGAGGGGQLGRSPTRRRIARHRILHAMHRGVQVVAMHEPR